MKENEQISTLSPKKKTFIEAWIKTFGNVTQSCEMTGIHRSTYYLWLKEDENFVNVIEGEEVQERFIDFLESKLAKKINDNDTTALIFALKTKGKKRGYIEKTEQENTNNNYDISNISKEKMQEIKKNLDDKI